MRRLRRESIDIKLSLKSRTTGQEIKLSKVDNQYGNKSSINDGQTKREFIGALVIVLLLNPSTIARGYSGGIIRKYPTRAHLALSGNKAVSGDVAYLTEPGREGAFVYSADDHSRDVEHDPRQGIFIPTQKDMEGRIGAWVRQYGDELTPEMFGAGGGASDDTAALIQWSRKLGHGVNGRAQGEYIVNGRMRIVDRSNFAITGGGTFRVKDAAPVDEAYSIFEFIRCSHWLLRGVTCDGNRANRLPAESGGHLVRVRECKYFRIDGIKTVNGTTDGIYLCSSTPSNFASHCSNFTISNVEADNNFRQGMSIIEGHEGLIVGGTFSNSNGAAPEAGIDMESNIGNPDGSISNISVFGSLFERNSGYGILVSGVRLPSDIKIANSILRNNALGAISFGATSGEILNPLIEGMPATILRGAIDFPASVAPGTGKVKLVNPTFRNASFKGARMLLYVHSESAVKVDCIGIDFDRTSRIAQLDAPGSTISLPRRWGTATANSACLVEGTTCHISNVASP